MSMKSANYQQEIMDGLPEVDVVIIFEDETMYQFWCAEIAAMPLVNGTIYRFYQSRDSSEHDIAFVTKNGRIFCVETQYTYDNVRAWVKGLAAWILSSKMVKMDGYIYVNRRNTYEMSMVPATNQEQIDDDLPEVDVGIVLENDTILPYLSEEIAAMPLEIGTIYRYYPHCDCNWQYIAAVTKHGHIFCVETQQTYDSISSWFKVLSNWILERTLMPQKGQIYVNRRNTYEINQLRNKADLLMYNEIKEALYKLMPEIELATKNKQHTEILRLKQAHITYVKQRAAKWDKYISS